MIAEISQKLAGRHLLSGNSISNREDGAAKPMVAI
jgi:hypothetical protein